MPQLVCMGAKMQCTFGAAPSSLTIARPGKVTTNHMQAAHIQDSKPNTNVPPFGMCNSMSNPAVNTPPKPPAPAPCTPMLTAPWAPPSTKVKVDGQPALLATATLTCAYAGVITITDPGQTKAQGT